MGAEHEPLCLTPRPIVRLRVRDHLGTPLPTTGVQPRHDDGRADGHHHQAQGEAQDVQLLDHCLAAGPPVV
eukprot:CAMPEP_0204342394 /NCGR_PEP_ID=MMETSP0469-20131031/24111_1 /ASSEMBLY_ACC=CAM_ASM_000384 /TAXON_ID=2969 /ORGANISM="Oxyrrhis marina" /LENGTH=70 /DNA_ID=CAMNT_0051327289 /DNA_START=45 /DNA_END=257 /DNA_ORIENTATION=-